MRIDPIILNGSFWRQFHLQTLPNYHYDNFENSFQEAYNKKMFQIVSRLCWFMADFAFKRANGF